MAELVHLAGFAIRPMPYFGYIESAARGCRLNISTVRPSECYQANGEYPEVTRVEPLAPSEVTTGEDQLSSSKLVLSHIHVYMYIPVNQCIMHIHCQPAELVRMRPSLVLACLSGSMITGYLANNSIHSIDTQFCEAATDLGTKVEFGVACEVATSGALATTMRLEMIPHATPQFAAPTKKW